MTQQPHADAVHELRLLAKAVIDRLEPVLRQAATSETTSAGCTWCPMCALAAALRGENHELIAVISAQGNALIALLRELVSETPHSADCAAQTGPAGTAESGTDTGAWPDAAGATDSAGAKAAGATAAGSPGASDVPEDRDPRFTPMAEPRSAGAPNAAQRGPVFEPIAVRLSAGV